MQMHEIIRKIRSAFEDDRATEGLGCFGGSGGVFTVVAFVMYILGFVAAGLSYQFGWHSARHTDPCGVDSWLTSL